MVGGSGAHATDRPVLAPLSFEVWSAEQPAANAALSSVHREERSSTRGACERQAHHSIVAQSAKVARYCGRRPMAKPGTSRPELIDTGRNKRFAKRDASGRFKAMDDVRRSLSADRRRTAKKASKPGDGDKGDRPVSRPSGFSGAKMASRSIRSCCRALLISRDRRARRRTTQRSCLARSDLARLNLMVVI
jgi:hypothetical protein